MQFVDSLDGKNEKHFMYIFNELMRYPEQVQDVLWNFLDSHDVPRALNMLAGPRNAGKIHLRVEVSGILRHRGENEMAQEML